MHADRVRRRRHDAAAGVEVLPGGDDRGVHGDDACASGGARAAGGVLLGPVQRVPGQPEGQGGRVDAVLAGFADVGHRGDPRAQPAGEGARGAGELDAAGPAGEGDAAARHRRHRGGQRVPAGVHGGLQPALRGGAAGPGGRAPRGASRRGGVGPDPVRAPYAQADEEPDDQLPEPRVPRDGARQGVPAARRAGHGVQGVRRLGDGAAGRSGVAGAAARDRRSGAGGGREDRCSMRGPSSGRDRPTSRGRIIPGVGRSSRRQPEW